MNAAALSEAIDAAGPLLQAHRRPGELEVDDEAAALVQIEALGCRIGGEQQSAGTNERPQHVASFARCHAAMEHQRRCRGRKRSRHPRQRVAILGEDDCGFAHSAKQSSEPVDLRFRSCRFAGGRGDLTEERPFERNIRQPARADDRVRDPVVQRVLVAERKRQLFLAGSGGCAEDREATCDGE